MRLKTISNTQVRKDGHYGMGCEGKAIDWLAPLWKEDECRYVDL